MYLNLSILEYFMHLFIDTRIQAPHALAVERAWFVTEEVLDHYKSYIVDMEWQWYSNINHMIHSSQSMESINYETQDLKYAGIDIFITQIIG